MGQLSNMWPITNLIKQVHGQLQEAADVVFTSYVWPLFEPVLLSHLKVKGQD